MMSHNFIFKEETKTDVVFECAICHNVISFNKSDVGSPSAVQNKSGDWQPPDDMEIYADSCVNLTRALEIAEATVVELKVKIAEELAK